MDTCILYFNILSNSGTVLDSNYLICILLVNDLCICMFIVQHYRISNIYGGGAHTSVSYVANLLCTNKDS